MTKSLERTAQRRKPLGEIERVAEIAVFRTLSETYRTCKRAGCHCQGDGPKPASECELPQQQMQQCLRNLAELNKERNLQRAIRNDDGISSHSPLPGIACLLPIVSSGS